MDPRRDDEARNTKPVRIPSVPPPGRRPRGRASRDEKARSEGADLPADRG